MDKESGIYSNFESDLQASSVSSSGEGNVFDEQLIDLKSPDLSRYKSLNSKLKFAFESNNIPRDITFVVGLKDHDHPLEKIHAHKFVIQLSSKKLCDLVDQKDKHQITIETHADAFKILLKYIYTEEAELEDVDRDLLMHLAELANKFEILALKIICCEQLAKIVTVDNAAKILQLASDVGHQLLYKLTLNFICRNADEVLQNGFISCSYTTACTLLRNDNLDASELAIFNSLCRWGKAQLSLKRVKISAHNLRSCLGELIALVRFPLMSPDDFITSVCPTGILNADEKTDVLQYFCVSKHLKRSFRPALFSCKPRIRFCAAVGIDSQIQAGAGRFYSKDLLEKLIKLGESDSDLTIQGMSLDLNQFIEDLSSLGLKVRRNIETLRLQNIRLEDMVAQITKCVRLANLRSFHLSINSSEDGDEADQRKLGNLLQNQLTRFLFFTEKSKNYPWPSSFSQLWKQDVNIEVIVCSRVLIKVDLLKGILVANKLIQIPLILKSLALAGGSASVEGKEIRKLAISIRSLEPEEILNPVESVKSLTIHHVKNMQSEQFRRFLSGCPNLTEAVFQDCGYQEFNLGFMREPKKLTRLALSHAFINLNTNKSEVLPEYGNLEILSLWNCIWKNDFEKKFPFSFPNIREVHIYNNFLDKPIFQFLEVCLQQSKVEKVVFSGALWGDQGVSRDKIQKKRVEMKNFLEEKGVTRRQTNFCLFRNPENGFDSWRSYEYTNNQITEAIYKQFHFDLFSLDCKKCFC